VQIEKPPSDSRWDLTRAQLFKYVWYTSLQIKVHYPVKLLHQLKHSSLRRFREDTPEILKVKEKEKGDWKKLSIDEKKLLYR
jgi:hypothetical protein